MSIPSKSVFLFLLAALPVFPAPTPVQTVTPAGQEPAKKPPFRLPSEVWANVQVMRNTDLKEYKGFVDLEEDVHAYIQYELKRIEASGKSFEGKETYYLGRLYGEVDRNKEAVRFLKRFLETPSSKEDPALAVKARSALVEALTELGELEEATLQLAVLEVEGAPLLDLLFMEIAKAYAARHDGSRALAFARKALGRMKPELAGFFLDHMLTHFMRYGLSETARTLLDDILRSMADSKDEATLGFLRTRKRQVGMVGRPVPLLIRPTATWIGGPSPGKGSFPGGKVTVLFFWASYCESCPIFFHLLGGLLEDYGKKGLQVFGVTAYHGRVAGFEKEGDRLDPLHEAELLNRYCKKYACPFPTMLDPNHEVEKAFHVTEIPHLVVVDRKGMLRCFFSGQTVEGDLLESLINDLLKEKPTQ